MSLTEHTGLNRACLPFHHRGEEIAANRILVWSSVGRREYRAAISSADGGIRTRDLHVGNVAP